MLLADDLSFDHELHFIFRHLPGRDLFRTNLLDKLCPLLARCHLNRGDCSGLTGTDRSGSTDRGDGDFLRDLLHLDGLTDGSRLDDVTLNDGRTDQGGLSTCLLKNCRRSWLSSARLENFDLLSNRLAVNVL